MNKEKLKRIPHIISGIIILLHSYERFENDHHSYLIFLIAGLIFLTFALFHHKIATKFPKVDTIFYIIEGTLSFIIAYEYFQAGKKGLPFVYVFAGLLQIFVIFKFASKKGNH